MNRDQKAAVIEEIAASIQEAEAVFAVDYRGISVPQAAELRARLRDADARFAVVKNTLTERAADRAGAEQLKALLEGPTALTFVSGDIASAAKALADYGRQTDLLPFKGGLMNGEPLDADQIRSIARLPSRDVLYGQLVGVVAHPIAGLARTLNALVSGLAIALGEIREKGLVGQDAGEAAESAEPAAETPEPGEPGAAEPGVAAESGTGDPEEDAAGSGTGTPDPADVEAAEAAAESGQDAEAGTGGEDPDSEPASTPDAPQPDQAEGEADEAGQADDN